MTWHLVAMVGKLHLAYEPIVEQQIRNVTVGRQFGSEKRRPVAIHRIITSDERDPSPGRNWWQKDAPESRMRRRGEEVGQTIMGFVKELVYGPKSKLNTGASI